MIEHVSVEEQRQRYNEEAADYQDHHGSELNQRYRNESYRAELFDIELEGKRVLDAMCGPGVDTGYFLLRDSEVDGLDISEENARIYEKKWGRSCHVGSVHQTNIDSDTYDVVCVNGGLHHVVPLLDQVFCEIYRILKPGGYFCFLEPNADDVFDYFRRAWYKKDGRFSDAEEAISYKKIRKPLTDLGFVEDKMFAKGNIAYILIGQSLILGTPSWLKRLIYGPAFFTERVLDALPFAPHFYFGARWRKEKSE